MISTANLEQAKKQIKIMKELEKEKPVIIEAQDDSFNRKILEYGHFDILLSPEKGKRKDSLRQRDSGLNHVLAKIASKNKVAIGFDLKEISGLEKKQKAIRLARIIQNIKVCRKSKTNLALSAGKTNASSFLISLGASTPQAKQAIYF